LDVVKSCTNIAVLYLTMQLSGGRCLLQTQHIYELTSFYWHILPKRKPQVCGCIWPHFTQSGRYFKIMGMWWTVWEAELYTCHVTTRKQNTKTHFVMPMIPNTGKG